jgi:hypothetical protein
LLDNAHRTLDWPQFFFKSQKEPCLRDQAKKIWHWKVTQVIRSNLRFGQPKWAYNTVPPDCVVSVVRCTVDLFRGQYVSVFTHDRGLIFVSSLSTYRNGSFWTPHISLMLRVTYGRFTVVCTGFGLDPCVPRTTIVSPHVNLCQRARQIPQSDLTAWMDLVVQIANWRPHS